MSNLSRFASFVGGLTAKKKGEDDQDDMTAEKPTQREDESDEDFQKRLKEWEDENPEGKKAEEPKDTTEDGPNKPDDKAVKAATDAGHTAGVKAEKARWTNVLADKAAVGRGVAALNLLADTDMTAESITKTLAALPAETGRSTLAARQPAPTPAPGTDGGEDETKAEGPKGFAARMVAAVEKARPSAKKS